MTKKSPEKFKVYKNVFDNFTLRSMFELESKHWFDEESLVPISIGKESNVFWGIGKQGDCVLKIYRLENCDFNRMYDYIKYDPRFLELKKNRRKVIFAWGQREYRNLLIAREAGVSAPMPYAIVNNVLIMEMVGKEEPAPKLKDLPPQNPEKFCAEVMKNVKRLYDAGYVHGDLSHFNILNDNERPVLIDFSSCTSLKNPNAKEFYERDLKNVNNFFTKLKRSD
ncbi:MAG: RIO1 family regulatory kinase/ATPase [Candidatus Woesearchaeota archaeon]